MAQDDNAANDGDILKHALLVEVLSRCLHWQSPTYAETHAGAGIYYSRNQSNEKGHIRTLQSTMSDMATVTTQQAGGRYTLLLQNWWKDKAHDGAYPGSVVQAGLVWAGKGGTGHVEWRVTEACNETHERLTDSLRPFGIAPEHAGFQNQIKWLTENDPLILIIDPFTYADDKDALAKGHIDLGTLNTLLEACWKKRACVVGFWCAAPHRSGAVRRLKFMKSLKESACNEKATLRVFKFGQFSMAWIGIGKGKEIVNSIPPSKRWTAWLRRIIKEDSANRVQAMNDLANLFYDLSASLPDEISMTLLEAADLRIERIISYGHASPADFWYDQPQHEWVIVLKGTARLQFEDGVVEMKVGDFINIPAFKKHRVDWTTPDEPTVWLGVRYGGELS